MPPGLDLNVIMLDQLVRQIAQLALGTAVQCAVVSLFGAVWLIAWRAWAR